MMRPDGQLNDFMHLHVTTRYCEGCITDRRRAYDGWLATATFMGVNVVNCLALAMRKDDDKDPVTLGTTLTGGVLGFMAGQGLVMANELLLVPLFDRVCTRHDHRIYLPNGQAVVGGGEFIDAMETSDDSSDEP